MDEAGSLLIESRSEFQAALRQAFHMVAEAGAPELWLSDPNFFDWPLSDSDVLADLTRWSLPHRRCHVLAQDFSVIERRHPRWVQWRRHWGHVVGCVTPDDSTDGRAPCLLWAPGVVSLRLVDVIHFRGRLSTDADDAVRLREEVGSLFQRAVESFPASTLGL
jgi:hypothetical protein